MRRFQVFARRALFPLFLSDPTLEELLQQARGVDHRPTCLTLAAVHTLEPT